MDSTTAISAALVDVARSGDRQALVTLSRLAAAYAQRVVRRVVTNEADAEEIAQESLYVMLRTLPRFEGRCRFETWLFAIVRSQISRKYRRMRAVPLSALGTAPDFGDEQAFEHAAEAHPDAGTALGLLDPTARAIVIGRDLEGMSSREVAARVSLSVGAVKSRLHRARERLREHFEIAHAA